MAVSRSTVVYGTRSELSCLLCARAVATVTREDHKPAVVQPIRPEYDMAVMRLSCPACRGRLMEGEREWGVVARRPLTPEEINPTRVRPPRRPATPRLRTLTDEHRAEMARLRMVRYRSRLRSGTSAATRWARDYDACVACGGTDSRHNARGMCNRCRNRVDRAARAAS